MNDAPLVPRLSALPETMLWPLYNRAAEARRPDARLDDPHAVRFADAIHFDYRRHFGKPDFSHALRALIIDHVLRDWLARNRGGQVVALGEGLESQFLRVDDGAVRWLSVDLPEAVALRERFVPDGGRHRNLGCSALDFRWMDEVDADRPLFVTAAGLLMYLQPGEVRRLVEGVCERFPTMEVAFDVVPRWFSRMTLKGLMVTPHYRAPPMPWGLDRYELPSIRAWHPNIAEVRELPFEGGRGFFCGVFLPVARRLPWLGSKWFSLVHLVCRAGRGEASTQADGH